MRAARRKTGGARRNGAMSLRSFLPSFLPSFLRVPRNLATLQPESAVRGSPSHRPTSTSTHSGTTDTDTDTDNTRTISGPNDRPEGLGLHRCGVRTEGIPSDQGPGLDGSRCKCKHHHGSFNRREESSKEWSGGAMCDRGRRRSDRPSGWRLPGSGWQA